MLSVPPKYLAFIVNPHTREVVLFNRRPPVLGANCWNGMVCPTYAYDDSVEGSPATELLYEVFYLTQSMYPVDEWMVLGTVDYPGNISCEILLSFSPDLSFAEQVNTDARAKVVALGAVDALGEDVEPQAAEILRWIDRVLEPLAV